VEQIKEEVQTLLSGDVYRFVLSPDNSRTFYGARLGKIVCPLAPPPGEVNVIRIDSEAVIYGSEGAEDVNRIESGLFDGRGGDDRVSGYLDGSAWFRGGQGNDRVDGSIWPDASFEGGPGNDFVEQLHSPNGEFRGGDGDDTVETLNYGTFRGEAGNDRVLTQNGGTFID